jgi:poly(3-hydroxybutyrate) depolymerase
MERDLPVFRKMLQAMEEQYHIDTTRVYLTGFSNGGVITRELGVTYPQLFAAISPWNAPGPDSITLYRVSGIPPMELSGEFSAALSAFRAEGWEMPCLYVYGDDDNKAPQDPNLTLETFLAVNGCGKEPTAVYTAENRYTAQAGYTEGDRFHTVAYQGRDGVERVACTTMKNMPHGAICDEARAAWIFLKQFRRQPGSRTVDVIG